MRDGEPVSTEWSCLSWWEKLATSTRSKRAKEENEFPFRNAARQSMAYVPTAEAWSLMHWLTAERTPVPIPVGALSRPMIMPVSVGLSANVVGKPSNSRYP